MTLQELARTYLQPAESVYGEREQFVWMAVQVGLHAAVASALFNMPAGNCETVGTVNNPRPLLKDWALQALNSKEETKMIIHLAIAVAASRAAHELCEGERG